VISHQRLQRLQVIAATEQNHLKLLNPLNPPFPFVGLCLSGFSR
jgi:hypothetical protein